MKAEGVIVANRASLGIAVLLVGGEARGSQQADRSHERHRREDLENWHEPGRRFAADLDHRTQEDDALEEVWIAERDAQREVASHRRAHAEERQLRKARFRKESGVQAVVDDALDAPDVAARPGGLAKPVKVCRDHSKALGSKHLRGKDDCAIASVSGVAVEDNNDAFRLRGGLPQVPDEVVVLPRRDGDFRVRECHEQLRLDSR